MVEGPMVGDFANKPMGVFRLSVGKYRSASFGICSDLPKLALWHQLSIGCAAGR
jgi:hypothetical protein